MSAGRVVMFVAGILLALVGVGFAATATAGLWLDATQQDEDGYLTSPRFELATDAYAVTGEELDLHTTPGDWTGWLGRVDLRLSVTPASDTEIFVGIAPEEDVADYLASVAHDRLERLDDRPGRTRYDRVPGTAVPEPPGEQPFWRAQVAGGGTQTLSWPAEAGRWSVVVMRADAQPGVDVLADAGVRTDLLVPISLGMLLAGLVLLAGAAGLVIAAVPSAARATPPLPPAAEATPGAPSPYPLVLRGRLDPAVSRWRWLVKWILLVPHILVLVALWVVFVATTIAAGFAILATGRYPRGLFDLNVGILRWSWRVTFYGYGVLGTDRYPPFTLDAVDYPAELTVAYPERLSRGLVLVKWWLLALPHWLVVALLTGGALSWTFGTAAEDSWRVSLGGGLIGLLALIVGITLLVRARYPRGLFDLLMGCNRWVYRVVAYAALMTDVYPPFRLDNGGEEPPVTAPPWSQGPSDAPRRHPEPVA
jgi:hypothetical protein